MAACASWIGWQLGSRYCGQRCIGWVDGLRLAAAPGLHGITANVGIGLAEPECMAFALHLLRPGDLFVDVGANAGSYSVLAASRGAVVVAAEPSAAARQFLERSLALNRLSAEVLPLAVSDRETSLRMDLSGGATAHVTPDGTDIVAATTLDRLVGDRVPALIKIDVEGHEAAVLAGGHRSLATALAAIIETWGDTQLHATLAALGLLPHSYDPGSRALTPRTAFEGAQSVIFLRDHAAIAARLKGGRAFRLGRKLY